MLASLPEAQYDHSEEEVPSKKSKTKKNAESVKKQPANKKTSPKKETSKKEEKKKVSSEEKTGWSWNKKKRGRPTSASKNPPLKIIPLGGLGEIGKNLTVYEYENEIIIVDCGMAFPDEEMLGIDLVIPDFSYLEENKDKIKGLFITHGHEDHIGAVPYLLQKLNIPVFATRFSMALIENKLAEKNLLSSAKLNVVKPGDIVAAGIMSVEFIYVNHSIPDSCALAIHTPAGVVIQTGDYKVDYTPTRGGIIDLARFGELGNKGVLALLSDSTNAERPGSTPSERVVGESFDVLFKNGSDKRIIVATFSSNVHRVQMVIESAVKFGRKVAVSGRSMEQVVAKALELGYLEAPAGTVVSLDAVNKLPENEVCIVTTGSQGEPMSALTRMSTGDHRKVNITSRDLVIISAYPIPGNEKYVGKVVNELMKLGAEVVYEKYSQIHVSGHACQDEQKLMLALTKPQYFIPVHGEYKHLKKHSDLALQMGMHEENVLIPELGRVIEVSVHGISAESTVTAGAVLVDGLGVGDVGNVVLRDRKHLGEDGLMVVSVTLSNKGKILAGPDILSRGFVYVKDSEELIENTKAVVEKAVLSGIAENKRDWQNLKTKIRDAASGYLYTATQRSPMILPIINELSEKDFDEEDNEE
ncbi:MAG: ribonuclease J [Oscillospiraceae bacterium]|nr:ribonuclease J [Oscillospiraceae bacterium]